MMFTNSYAACQVCAPTGADLMTRKYPGLIKQLYAKKIPGVQRSMRHCHR